MSSSPNGNPSGFRHAARARSSRRDPYRRRGYRARRALPDGLVPVVEPRRPSSHPEPVLHSGRPEYTAAAMGRSHPYDYGTALRESSRSGHPVSRAHQPNRLGSLSARPPPVQQTNETGLICTKMQCAANDIACLLNKTMTIQWQYIALPSMPRLQAPQVLLNVQTIGYSVFPNLHFEIIRGNDHGLFDVVKSEIRLIKPITGPQTHYIKLQMDNRNRFNTIISTHIAFVTIEVSPNSF